MSARRTSTIEREQKAQIRAVRFEHRQSPKVVRAVAGDDAEPSIQEVVRFVDERAVMGARSESVLARQTCAHVRVAHDRRAEYARHLHGGLSRW